MSDLKPEYKSGYRLIERLCKPCGQVKAFPSRNKWCSSECAKIGRYELAMDFAETVQEMIEPEGGYAVSARSTQRIKHPTGWEPCVQIEGDGGTIITKPTESETITDEKLLADSELDPAIWAVVGDINFRKWQTNIPVEEGGADCRCSPRQTERHYEERWLRYYKANVRRRSALIDDNSPDYRAIIEDIRAFKPGYLDAVPAGPCAMVVNIADMQLGKPDGDGVQGTKNRFLTGIDSFNRHVDELVAAGREMETLYIFGMGDLIENCSGHYAQQTYLTELNMREQEVAVTHLLLKAVKAWAPRFKKVVIGCVGGNHGECFDSSTELLTVDGWMRVDAMNGREVIATLNPLTHAFEWQDIRHWTELDFAGHMVHLRGRSGDLLVTPNHDIYTTRKYGAWTTPRASNPANWFKRVAAVVEPNTFGWLHAAASFDGSASEIKLPAYSDSLGRHHDDGYLFDDLDLAAKLFGWYVSEGTCDGTRVTISQSREVHPEHHATICSVIEQLGFTPSPSESYVRFNSPSVAAFLLSEFGATSHEKHLPKWLKEWPPALLKTFLDTAIDGDGRRYSDHGSEYTSTSRQLIDDMQEVSAKLGLRSSIVSFMNGSEGRYESAVGDSGYSGTAIKLAINDRRISEIGEVCSVPYEGKVYCPTVQNGLVFARRSGRVVVAGNCRQDGKSFTDFGDNSDVKVFDFLRMILRENPAFDHVSFVIPKDELALTFDVYGTIIAITHGQVFGKSNAGSVEAKAQKWWDGQMRGKQPAGDADILITAHFHHFIISNPGSRTHMQCPALEGGSKWFTDTSGMSSYPGMLCFLAGKNVHPTGRGWALPEVI